MNDATDPADADYIESIHGEASLPLNLNKLRVKVAELRGLNPIKVPFKPNVALPGLNGDWFTPEAARHMRKVYPRGANPKVIPNYPTDLNACRELLQIVADSGWDIEMRNNRHSVPWSCLLWKHGACRRGDELELATAICRAFIAAMEASSVPERSEKHAAPQGKPKS